MRKSQKITFAVFIDKFLYKWTYAVPTRVVQGSTILLQMQKELIYYYISIVPQFKTKKKNRCKVATEVATVATIPTD